jgi:hypothetical protein
MKRLMQQWTWGWALIIGFFIVVGHTVGWAADTNIWQGTGNIGIGTLTPSAPIDIRADAAMQYLYSTGNNNSTLWFGGDTDNNGTGQRYGQIGLDYTNNSIFLSTGSNAANRHFLINGSGNVGVGTTSPATKLDVWGPSNAASPVVIRTSSGAGGMSLSAVSGYAGLGLGSYWDGSAWRALNSDSALFYKDPLAHQFAIYGNSGLTAGNTFTPVKRFVMALDTGNVGIGTTTPAVKLHVVGPGTQPTDPPGLRVDGNAIVSGNIAAKYQDVAEWVPTKSALLPGTVVIIDSQATNQVLPAVKPYDTRVAGVVSTQPGLLLGEAGDDKAKIAHSGRVPVKVDASFGSIAAGDLLVTSPTSGYAMRSTPVDLGGVSIHRPGTVVGKALEPLTEGQGEILVLLTLQ